MARYALVIGISEYKEPFDFLSKADTDAYAVKELLEKYGGYRVTLLTCSVTRTDLFKALQTFLQEQAVRSETLIYFTGHGFQKVDPLGADTPKGYLATSDCVVTVEDKQITKLQQEGLSFEAFNKLIKESNLGSLVVLLDACHSGNFIERTLVNESLSSFNSRTDYYLITACRGFEEAIAKKREAHSVFTGALLDGLSAKNVGEDGRITSDRLSDFIYRELARSKQEPFRMGNGRPILLMEYQPPIYLKTPSDAVLQSSEGVSGKFSSIPNPVPCFRSRPDDLKALKEKLLANLEKPSTVTDSTRRVVVHGMGGVGKTVLAAEVALDKEIQQAFRDGVLWLVVGQEPTSTLLQLELARILGDNPQTFISERDGETWLKKLLTDKTCLLILDYVWKAEHLSAFDDILAPSSQMLITTRDSNLIAGLGADEYQLGVLNDEQALELLAEWAGQAAETLPDEAQRVAEECGNLPLALAIVGGMVRGGTSWDNVLHKLQKADLQKIRQQFTHYPHPDLLKAIQVSVAQLDEPNLRERYSDIQSRYLDFAVFQENIPIPQTVLQIFWEPEGMDQYDSQDVVDELVKRSLVQRDAQKRLSLHPRANAYSRSKNL